MVQVLQPILVPFAWYKILSRLGGGAGYLDPHHYHIQGLTLPFLKRVTKPLLPRALQAFEFAPSITEMEQVLGCALGLRHLRSAGVAAQLSSLQTCPLTPATAEQGGQPGS